MYRSLAVRLAAIIVMLAAVAPTVAAQRGSHGGSRGGGVSVFRGAPVVRNAPGPAFIGRPVAPFVTSPVAPFVTSPVTAFGTSPFAAPFRVAPFGVGRFPHSIGRFPHPIGRFPRTVVVSPVIGFDYYSPYIWPTTAYGAPPYYGSYDAGYAPPAAPAPPVSQGEVERAYQVGRLSEEIQQLREQQTLRQPQQPQSQTQSAPAVPTVLVFRDGHRVEIQNYAIIGQTLWVLDEKTSTKISISDL